MPILTRNRNTSGNSKTVPNGRIIRVIKDRDLLAKLLYAGIIYHNVLLIYLCSLCIGKPNHPKPPTIFSPKSPLSLVKVGPSAQRFEIRTPEDLQLSKHVSRRSRVQRFRGSEVQGSILVPGLNLECVFTSKASSSSGLIQILEPNWQLLGKMNIFNEDFGSSMPSLSLTLNVEP